MKFIGIFLTLLLFGQTKAQSLDLGTSIDPMVLPRLSSDQMNAITDPQLGMLIYNTDEHQIYGYMRYRSFTFPIITSTNRWQPVSTGPRMLAWGVVDSFTNIKSGSQNFTIDWDTDNHWFRLGLSHPHEYYKDSMILLITPVGNGSWDQMPATGELIEGNSRFASIKFTDASRIVAGYSDLDRRRKSGFHFVLYDLRKFPYP